ncbi:MAG TPA: OmpA family protein [Noviherbaspirillum sp.]|nr:OmpA family protein [Noviherbaspirillum sp.]
MPPSRIVISGTVPDEATKAALLARLAEIYGAAAIDDRVAVGGVIAPPNWAAHVPKVMTQQLKSISKGQLVIEGTNISLRGEVESEAVRQEIASNVASALNPTYVIKNGLRVTAASQAVIDQTLANRIVEFEPGSALLTESGKLVLNEITQALKQVKAKRLDVIGHTDNSGIVARNLALSRARADSVKTYLVEQGISPELIGTSGIGADQPIASNATEEGRKRNRRIEFRIGQ